MSEYEPIGTLPIVGDTIRWQHDDTDEFFYTVTVVDTDGVARGYSNSRGKNSSWAKHTWEGDWNRILKRDKKDEKGVGGNNSEKNDDKVDKLVNSRVLSLALERISQKTAENGPPEDSFTLIANFWNEYIYAKEAKWDKDWEKMAFPLTPDDVAAMMILMKVARHVTGAGKEDNAVDIAGYAHFLETLRPGQEDTDVTEGITEKS